MNQERVFQMMELFKTTDPDKWNAFLDLYAAKQFIQNEWFRVLKAEADRKFKTDEFVEGWGYDSWGIWDMQWFQKPHGDQSIRLFFGWDGVFALRCNNDNYLKIHDLVKTEKFAPLLNCFIQDDGRFVGDIIIKEIRNFSFNSPYDKRFDPERLSWYAGNKTEKFLDQIVEKVNRFRKDPKINLLLHELNLEAKKA
jgi:hypothetical protein